MPAAPSNRNGVFRSVDIIATVSYRRNRYVHESLRRLLDSVGQLDWARFDYFTGDQTSAIVTPLSNSVIIAGDDQDRFADIEFVRLPKEVTLTVPAPLAETSS